MEALGIVYQFGVCVQRGKAVAFGGLSCEFSEASVDHSWKQYALLTGSLLIFNG